VALLRADKDTALIAAQQEKETAVMRAHTERE